MCEKRRSFAGSTCTVSAVGCGTPGLAGFVELWSGTCRAQAAAPEQHNALSAEAMRSTDRALSSPPNGNALYAGLRTAYLGLSVGDWPEAGPVRSCPRSFTYSLHQVIIASGGLTITPGSCEVV